MSATLANTLRWVTVRMSDSEWDNGQNMDEIAREQFSADEDSASLVVEVREHAGWYVEYAWDGDLVRLGSANCANRGDRANAWRDSHRHCDYAHVGTVYRS